MVALLSENSSRRPPSTRVRFHEVTIETPGEEGDEMAKVERGYILIVNDGQAGETVAVDLHTVHENVAFAEIVEADS